jgi:transmembrane sensor
VNKDIYHIASDYFSSRISEDDLNFLHSWLAESDDNKLLLDELKQIWKMTGELSFKLSPDVDAEWNKFLVKRDETNNQNIDKIDKKIHFRKSLKIAAVLIPAILVLSLFINYLTNKSKTVELIALNTAKGKRVCILPDGTKVWINANSNFVYPSEFSNSERRVKLEGEAYFEVVKGDLPFKIVTGNNQITVVGTAFNVRAVKKETFTEVVVSRGTVIFKNIPSNKESVLVAGEKGTYNEISREMIKEKLTGLNAIGWKDEQLLFQDTPLSEIETILSRYFNVNVKVSSLLKECKFTGEFKQAQLDEILKVISISLGTTYLVKNDTVFIQGQGCKK